MASKRPHDILGAIMSRQHAAMVLSVLLATALVMFLNAPVMAQGLSKQDAHIKIENPKKLSAKEANNKYNSIVKELQAMYALSKDPAAKSFLNWSRLNTAPYLSATHGNRYVNNYANTLAKDYALVGTGKKKNLPPGSILAKDSFTVTAEGKVYGGALFLMQKLKSGISPETGNWRYWMILPDGSIFGDSEADSAGDVTFCHSCHTVKADRDFLFYIPKAYRK